MKSLTIACDFCHMTDASTVQLRANSE